MSKNTFIGFAVLALIVIFVLFILGMNALSSFSFFVEFEDIKGLKVGDRVYLRGVDIGQVTDTNMSPSGKVKTTLRIDKKYTERLKSDSDFFIRNDSLLLGKKCIQMHINDEESPLIQDGQVFQGSPAWKLYVPGILR